MNKLNKLIRSDGFNSAMSSIFAILIGLAFGFIVLLISGFFLILSKEFGVLCIIISSTLLILWTMLFVQRKT